MAQHVYTFGYEGLRKRFSSSASLLWVCRLFWTFGPTHYRESAASLRVLSLQL